jgi:autotransporter-associated beta strand protein
MKTYTPCPSRAFVALLLALPFVTQAQTWNGNGNSSAGGNWSTATNWDAGTVPSTGNHTAILDDTGADRTIIYDSGASGALGNLTFTQSSAFANTLDIQRTLAVTSSINLGATTGTERISVSSNATTGFVLTCAGGITLDAGGQLILTATGNGGSGFNFGNAGSANTTLTIQGGTLTVAPTTGTSSAGSAANTLTGNLTMTSGSLVIDNAGGGASKPDRRLTISGLTTITGGSITSTLVGPNGSLAFQGASITLNPASFDADLNLSLELAAAQSLTTNQTLGVILARSTGIKTVTSSAVGTGIGQLQMFDGNSAASNSRTTLKLGSNLTLTSGRNQPAAQSFGNTHEAGRVDLGVDTNGFTLDLSAGAGAGVWTVNASTQSGVTNTVWDLSGNGTIKANGFNLSSANVTTNIAAGTTLLATGGDGVLFHLGTLGTISPDATFRYSGNASTAAPTLMTAFRNIGDVEVTSGALRLRSISSGTQQDLRVSGGTMDLEASTARSFTTISLTGGNLTNGTYASAETDYTGLQTGTVAGRLTGAKKLVKNSPGTLTLSGSNDYSGVTQVQSGTLAITNVSALTGTPSLEVTGGTLDLGGLSYNKFIGALTNGGIIQNGTFARTSVTGWTLSNGTLSANLTTSGNGSIALTKNTSGTVILSGTNTHLGNTTVFAGTLLLNGDSSLNVGTLTVSANATLGGSGTIGQAATVSANATLSPGSSGVGVLAFSSDLSLASGSSTQFEIGGGVRGITHDGINVGGNLTYGGTLSVAFSVPATAGATYSLFAPALSPSGTFGAVNLTGSHVVALTGAGGVWTGSNSGLNFTFTESTGNLVVGSALSALQSWRQTYFSITGNTGNAADAFDFDNDGVPNLLEYATGSDPTVSSPAPTVLDRNVGGFLTISFNSVADATITYTVEGSSDLTGAWSNVFTATGATLGAGPQTIADTTLPGTRRFLRLKVSY